MTTNCPDDIQQALTAISDRPFSHLFLVACGGSLSVMMAGKYFADRHSATLACDIYNGDEFVCRDPARLGQNTLVILCSQTGTTKETVRAARHAKARGATTIGMTLDPQSPLAGRCRLYGGVPSFLHDWQADRFRLQQLRRALHAAGGTF